MRITVHDDFKWRVTLEVESLKPFDESVFRRQPSEVILVEGEASRKRRYAVAYRAWKRLVRMVEEAAAELGLQDSVSEVLLLPSTESGEPSVDLVPGADGNLVSLRMCPIETVHNRTGDDEPLINTVRHELTHPRDELDLAFGYTAALRYELERPIGWAKDPIACSCGKGRQRVNMTHCFGELWNVNIDGRLQGRGVSEATRRRGFGATFPKATDKHLAVFEDLWRPVLVPCSRLVELSWEFVKDRVWTYEGMLTARR